VTWACCLGRSTSRENEGGDVSLSAAEVRSLYDRLQSLHQDSARDCIGTRRFISPVRVRAAAGQVRLGRTASLAVGRGVLLDIPRLRGIDWLEPRDHVTADDLISAQQA
jgi:hypothetical protein